MVFNYKFEQVGKRRRDFRELFGGFGSTVVNKVMEITGWELRELFKQVFDDRFL